MASALLVKNKISAQTHNGVVGQLGMHFVKTGKLNKEDGRLAGVQTISDYDLQLLSDPSA